MAQGRKRFLMILLLALPLSLVMLSSRLFSIRFDRNSAEIARNVTFIMARDNGNTETGKFHDVEGAWAANRAASQSGKLLLSNEPTDKAAYLSKRLERQKRSTSFSNKILPQYDKSFRNPCWYDEYNHKTTFKCFPYVYLAGFPKSGTTDFYGRLVAHPLIMGGRIKGPHYFTRRFFELKQLPHCSSNFDCDTTIYASMFFTDAAKLILMTNDTKLMNSTFLTTERSNPISHRQVEFVEAFPRESLAIWKQAQKFHEYPGIIADGSPSTSWDVHNFKGIVENRKYGYPRNTSADWVRQIYPGSKIIMTLRDPVERAFSDYIMYFKNRSRASDFHRKVVKTTRQIGECLESGRPALLCVAYKYQLRLQVGMYYCHVQNWFNKYPREQILLVKQEDYAANMTKSLAGIFEFLDLPAIGQEGLEFISKLGVLNAAHSKKPEMFPETRTLLTNFYKPYNEKLAELVNDDKFLWHKY